MRISNSIFDIYVPRDFGLWDTKFYPEPSRCVLIRGIFRELADREWDEWCIYIMEAGWILAFDNPWFNLGLSSWRIKTVADTNIEE